MSRYGIMATQLLATLTTVHHLLKREIVVYLVNLRHLLHSISLDVCFTSQLVRCFYVSFLSGSWVARSLRRSILLEFLFPLVVMLVGVPGARHRDNDGDRINVHSKCNLDHEDCVSLRSPSILPYAWISGRDSCLVGVSCHVPASPRIRVLHHVYFPSETWNGDWSNPRTRSNQIGST